MIIAAAIAAGLATIMVSMALVVAAMPDKTSDRRRACWDDSLKPLGEK